MQHNRQLDYLEQRIGRDIAKLRKQSGSFKGRASRLNLATILLGGTITVLLGLSMPSDIEPKLNLTLKNLALLCGVLTTIFSAIEKFSENRSIWVKQRGTVLELYSLQSEIEFYKAGIDDENTIDGSIVRSFFDQYQEIWRNSTEEWKRIRGKSIFSTTMPTQQVVNGDRQSI